MAATKVTLQDRLDELPAEARQELLGILASVRKAQAGLDPDEQLPPHPRKGVRLPRPEMKAMFRLVANEQGLCSGCEAQMCRRRGECRGSPDVDMLSCIDRFSELSLAKLRAAFQGVLLAWTRREAVYEILRETHPDDFKHPRDLFKMTLETEEERAMLDQIPWPD